MKNYKLTIAYDGSRYSGWERQKNADTIQGKIESVLARMCGSSVSLCGAGRTDAGVHAKAMVANVHLVTTLDCDKIKEYLNHYLPNDIAVAEVRIASENFHARYHAVGKLYRYTCYDGTSKPVFQRKYTTVLPASVNVQAMEQAARYLVGEHDFRSFCGNPRIKKSTVRVVDSIEIRRSKDFVFFSFHGTGFLQNMVRILVGTLLEVGYGKILPQEVADILAQKDRSLAGPTAPPEGLCLESVDY